MLVFILENLLPRTQLQSNTKKPVRNQPSPNLISDVLTQVYSVYSVLYFLIINTSLTLQLKIDASNDDQHMEFAHKIPLIYQRQRFIEMKYLVHVLNNPLQCSRKCSLTISESFENHAMGLRCHKAAWNHSLTLGQVWTWLSCGLCLQPLRIPWVHIKCRDTGSFSMSSECLQQILLLEG